MGMRGNARSVQSRVGTPLVLAGLLVVPVYTGGAFAQGDGEDSAFQYEERSTIDTIPCDFNEKALRYKRLLNVRETMLHTRPVKLPEEIARGKPILRWFLACFQRNKPLRRTHSTMAPYLKISEAGIHVIRGYTFQSSCPKLLWHTVAHIAG